MPGGVLVRQVIDLTGQNFDRMDFCEAEIIDFFVPYNMPDTLEFSIWGGAILLDSHWNHDKNFLPEYIEKEDQYVCGLGIVKINGLKGGYVEIFPYENKRDIQGRTICAKNIDGTDLIFRREWNFTCNNEYLWECVIAWPYGFCRIEVSCDNVSYEFDDESLIELSEYLKNSESFWKKVELDNQN